MIEKPFLWRRFFKDNMIISRIIILIQPFVLLGAGKSRGLRVVSAAFVLSVGACDSKLPPDKAVVGKAAPEIAALDLGGQAIHLGDYDGRFLVLAFWLGGCAPCAAEMPVLKDLGAGREGDLKVLTINVGGNADVAAGLAAEFGDGFDYAVDQLALTATRYGVRVFPTLAVIDKRGRLIGRQVGEVRAKDLSALAAAR